MGCVSCGRKPEERGVYFDAAVGLSLRELNSNIGIEKRIDFFPFFSYDRKIMELGGMK